MWEKANVGKRVWDVVCLRNGTIAFTETDSNNIILMDREGKVLTESVQKIVGLQEPRAIAYHPTHNSLLICDKSSGYITLLNTTTLSKKTNVRSGITGHVATCVMSNGNIVVGGGSKEGFESVGVFDIDGRQLQLWDTYNDGAGTFKGALYIHVTVDAEDNILVSNYKNKKIIKFNKTGRFLCEWSAKGAPLGLTVAGNIVLVAERKPDCVMAYNWQGRDARQVMAWDIGQSGQFGSIRSLSTQETDLVVVGDNGVRMYKLTTR